MTNEKAKIEILPSAVVKNSAATRITVTDESGRIFTIKKPKPLDGLDFKLALGANHTNTLYLVEVSHLQYVAEIDGEPVNVPKTELQLRSLYQRLGDDGNSTVQKAVIENFFSEEAEKAKDAEVKNS